MALILNIETATKNCSVSIAKDGAILALKELNNAGYSHAEKLHVFIDDVLTEANLKRQEIDAIAVSKGPGSYTGLRIGVSAAKGLCFALDIPLIATDTLTALAKTIKVEDSYIIPMIDARRMEVYAKVLDSNYNEVRTIEAEIVTSESFESYLEDKKVYFLGDGAEKCKDVITHKNAVFIADKHPSAKEMASLSYQKFKETYFEDVAYFEPFYLKAFLVTPEKRK